jgi:hypothetical protein
MELPTGSVIASATLNALVTALESCVAAARPEQVEDYQLRRLEQVLKMLRRKVKQGAQQASAADADADADA